MGAPRVLGFRGSTAVDMAAFSNAQRKALHDSGRGVLPSESVSPWMTWFRVQQGSGWVSRSTSSPNRRNDMVFCTTCCMAFS